MYLALYPMLYTTTTTTFSKVLEKVIHKKLHVYSVLVSKDILYKRQYGFRKGKQKSCYSTMPVISTPFGLLASDRLWGLVVIGDLHILWSSDLYSQGPS